MSKVEDEVCELIQARAKVGLEKYGVTMEREDFTHLDWLTYLQEELMDAVVYLQRLRTREQTLEMKLRELIADWRSGKWSSYKDGKSHGPLDLEALFDEVSE